MTDNNYLTDLPLAGELVATDFESWPDWLKTEFAEHAFDGNVGSRLLSEDSRVRVWEIRLAPGGTLACPPACPGLLLDRDQRR